LNPQETNVDHGATEPKITQKDSKREMSTKAKKWKDRLANKKAKAESSSSLENEKKTERQEAVTPESNSPPEQTLIQGTPPNKAKKWKDRLADKKAIKAESSPSFEHDKAEAGTTNVSSNRETSQPPAPEGSPENDKPEMGTETTTKFSPSEIEQTSTPEKSLENDKAEVGKQSITNASFNKEREQAVIQEKAPVMGESVIQGMPPNKGKKWKDRLAKKRGQKSADGSDEKPGNPETGFSSVPEKKQVVAGSSPLVAKSVATAISDVTMPPDDHLLSPDREARKTDVANSPRSGQDSKTRKWKDRLAKRRSTKLPVLEVKGNQETAKLVDADMTGRTILAVQPDDDKMAETAATTASTSNMSTEMPMSIETAVDRVVVDSAGEPLGMEDPVDAGSAIKKTSKKEAQKEQDLLTPKLSTDNEKHSAGTDKPGIRNDLLQSFNAFDSFLQGRPATLPTDEESIYTEITIEQESMAQTGSVANRTHDDQSYMEFTVEDSVQPSYVDETIASGSMNIETHSKQQNMMSPFMSNLLSSRLFQEIAPSIPTPTQNKNLDDHFEHSSKKYPTILVNSAADDDDMTQLTMDHTFCEDEDHDDEGQIPEREENEDSPYVKQQGETNSTPVTVDNGEEYFDAVSKPLPLPAPALSSQRPPLAKTSSVKSRHSLKSRKSSISEKSGSSQISSESSKQRIAEILRKDVWSRDVAVVQEGMEELSKQASNGRKYRAHIVRCGGVMAITRTMEMNADHEGVQVPCCKTLEKLALEPETQSAICEMEGIPLIVRTMQDHADNILVQEAACAALASISRRQETEDYKDSMKEAKGAVFTLLTSMTRYSDNPRIQAKAFAAIANLCMESHERLAELSEGGGIMTLTLALQKPWDDKHEQHAAISNLSILLRGITELNASPSPRPKADKANEIDMQDGDSLDSQSDVSRYSSDEDEDDNDSTTQLREEPPKSVSCKQEMTNSTSEESESMSTKADDKEKVGADKEGSREVSGNGEPSELEGAVEQYVADEQSKESQEEPANDPCLSAEADGSDETEAKGKREGSPAQVDEDGKSLVLPDGQAADSVSHCMDAIDDIPEIPCIPTYSREEDEYQDKGKDDGPKNEDKEEDEKCIVQ